MAAYGVRIYKDTGFSPMNIPDSKALLDKMPYEDLPAVFTLQDLNVTRLRVQTTWDAIMNADYCKLNNKFYFVTGVTMVNENTAELALDIDALTTIGIDNISINSGWCTRRHVQEDTLFSNIIDEDWGPSEPFEMDTATIGPVDNLEQVYVCSAVDLNLSSAKRTADKYEDAAGGSVVVPRCPEAAVSSEVMLDFSSQGTQDSSLIKKLPTTTLYKGTWKDGSQNREILESIAILRSLGLENAITGAYAIPSGYIDLERTASMPNYQVYNIASFPHEQSGPAFKWSPGSYTVRNNKVFAGQYNKFMLTSPVSGDSVTLDAHDIKIAGDDYSKFTFFADLGPGGAPYCRPTQYRGVKPANSNPWYEQCVVGGNWLSAPIAYSGTSGSLITQTQAGRQAYMQSAALQLNRDSAEFERNMALFNTLSSGVTRGVQAAALGGPAGGLAVGGAAISTGVQIHQTERMYEMRKRGFAHDELNIGISQFNTLASTSLVPPEIKFPRTDAIQSFTGNKFQVVRFRLSNRDTERFDRYLTMFGYRVSEILSIGCFSGRQYFNFVEANSVDISVPSNVPMRLKMRAIEQISNGIRVWHVKPSNVYFNNNPIV